MLRIRTAEPGEQRALEALQRRASLAREEYRAQLLAEPDAVVLPLEQLVEGRVIVVECGAQVAGLGVWLRRDDREVELDGLFVEPALWRRGLGAALVWEIERRAIAEGATVLHVIANPTAEAFYLACGFAFSGEQLTRFGVARTMRKALKAGR
jgi:GNAT superfamily N-acetyltransferase